MTGLVLELQAPLSVRVDLAGVTPDRLTGLTTAEAASLRVPAGGRSEGLGALFRIEAGEEGRIEIHGGDRRLDGVGAGMRAGEITLDGDCGACAGAGMTGGTLTIRGSCDGLLAAGMGGGRIRVEGRAGGRIGGTRPGARRGMIGGTVFVAGDAGAKVGERMRRGLIVVEGSVGPGCASAMIAGTIAVGGIIGRDVGRGMRRGTIIARAVPEELPAGFEDAGAFELIFVSMVARRLAGTDGWIGRLDPVRGSTRRLVGDLHAGGQGEILVLPT